MSNSQKVERKLAAIMFTDIVGYTEQMSKDQDVAFALLEEKQSKFKPLIKEHNGSLIKEMGDGTLSQYPSAIDASKCSVELQKLIKDNDKLNVRVGIHLGDTLFKDGDVFGDGVNIAARLESMSPAGGILVSKNVYDELLTRQGFEGVSLGMQSLKGVGRLVEVYALKDTHLTVPNPDDFTDTKVEVHSDDEVPSIAIIPFKNKGADEDVFYAYGISVDLISDVSSAGLIRVASKKQIEDAGDLPLDELAKKLDVRYMANGELWRMGDMFQLSVELYDTKDKKVVWSDRWQQKWDNLPNIKTSLSDGLLKALDAKPKVEQKVETTNTEAYEFYLKAKHKYEKRGTTDDTEITRGLLNKAIELDDNLILAKTLLGTTYRDMGDYDEAMEIYTPVLKQAEELRDEYGMGIILIDIGLVHYSKGEYDKPLEYFSRSLAIQEELGDKYRMGSTLNNIGLVHANRGDYDRALDYYVRSLAIQEELGDKTGMGNSLGNIGIVHMNKGDYDRALDYYGRTNAIKEELGDKTGMGTSWANIGLVHNTRGDYDKALDYYARSLTIQEELGDKRAMGIILSNIGIAHANRGDSGKALEHLEKSLTIQKEIGLGANYLIWVTLYLYLTYKQLAKDYDINEIHSLIKEASNIQFGLNLGLYQLLEEESYLENAYNQLQEKASSMEKELAEKFLSYPIPKAIAEEWEKLNN
jgi:class 3 adenylate cyclase/tetratricopeptide (TPR) repeat protein